MALRSIVTVFARHERALTESCQKTGYGHFTKNGEPISSWPRLVARRFVDLPRRSVIQVSLLERKGCLLTELETALSVQLREGWRRIHFSGAVVLLDGLLQM